MSKRQKSAFFALFTLPLIYFIILIGAPTYFQYFQRRSLLPLPAAEVNIHDTELAVTPPEKMTQHGARCTKEQSEWIATQDPIANSNCPQRGAWMNTFELASIDNPSATLVSIGCNRGDDLANKMRYWSRNTTYSHKAMLPHMSEFQSSRSCPIDPEADISTSQRRVRPVHGYCIEAMKTTFDTVKNIYKTLGWDTEIQVIHAAMSSVPGMAEFPKHSAGIESLGIGSESQFGNELVNVSTVDELVKTHNLQKIDILSIDTEGNDMRVIFGAVHSLSRVRFLEFEYHNVNRWQYSDLQDLIDLLDQFNFDCYWPLNDGRLFRLTGCWHDSYYAKRTWSNVACCNRNEIALHNAMDNLANSQKYQ
jgi:FkbM family methyltransferase